MKKKIFAMFLGLLAASVNAASYVEVYSWDKVLNGNGSSSHYCAVSDGENSYHLLALGGGGAITKIDKDGNASTLCTALDISFATLTQNGASESYFTSLYGLSLIPGVGGTSDAIVLSDSKTDAVWSIDSNTGVITCLANSASIPADDLYTPGTAYNGSYYFYGKTVDNPSGGDPDEYAVFSTDGQAVSTVLSYDSIMDFPLSGGLTFDGQGNMVFGSSSSDSMYSYDGDSITTLLSKEMITEFTGKVAAGFGDLFYAPDGNVYFYETTSDSILSFDPADAANTLAFVLTEDELLAGPAEYDNVYGLTWHNDNLAFNFLGSRGFYAVPEPMTMSLLGIGTLTVFRRRRAN